LIGIDPETAGRFSAFRFMDGGPGKIVRGITNLKLQLGDFELNRQVAKAAEALLGWKQRIS
jgi:hypothetical protein